MNISPLKKVIIVARHGPRIPICKLSTLPQQYWDNLCDTSNEKNMVTKASLTIAGENLCQNLGKSYATRFENLNFIVKEHEIKSFSSKIEKVFVHLRPCSS